MQASDQAITYGRHIRALAILGIPIIVGQLGTIIQGLADTIMVGHFSAHSLAAAGFVNNIMVLVLIFALGYSYAITPVIGPMHARGEFENAGKALKAGLQVNGALGMVLFLLMGTDMFLSFETWHEPEKIASLAGIAAFGRTKADMEPQFSAQRDKLYRLYPDARIFTLTVPGVIDISSTELREQLASGTGENLLPPAVYGYILRNHLYGTDVNLKNLTLSQLRPVALSYLKYKRIPHVLGTEQEAIRLATRYGADVEKARVAALLHDCTKKLDMPEQLALCRQYGIELDELEQKALKLLHAKTGAAIAREVFGVDDEIYRAIWWHTTGHADMTLLEKIIYLADYIEPSRDFPGVNDLRACVYENLDRGMLMGLEMTIDEMTEMGNPVHHATVEARDWLKGKR